MHAAGSGVDIVVASNRPSPFLAEGLRSVQAQTYKNWQLILVDDGSVDPAFFDALAASIPAAVCLHQEARGVSAARNAGIAAGRGELVAFLDDDDVWHPERLALQVQALEQEPESVAAYSGGWYMDAAGERFGDGWQAERTPTEKFLSGEVNIPRIVTLMVRRGAFDRVGSFDESLSLGEDDDFILRLAQLGQFSPVSRELVGYRRHQKNATNAPAPDRRRSSERLLLRQIEKAHSRGDHRVATMLRENLRRFRTRAAGECVGSLVAGVRVSDWGLVRAELAWAVTVAPMRSVRAAFTKGWGSLARTTRGA